VSSPRLPSFAFTTLVFVLGILPVACCRKARLAHEVVPSTVPASLEDGVSRWVRELGSEDAAVRREAVDRLTAAGPSIIDRLIPELEDDAVTSQVAAVLGAWGPDAEAASGALAERLRAGSRASPPVAAALARIGAPSAPALIPLLTEVSEGATLWAVRALADMEPFPESVETVDLLIKVAKSDHPELRRAALIALSRARPIRRAAIPPVLTGMQDRDWATRTWAVQAAEHIGSYVREPALVRALCQAIQGDEAVLVRRDATAVLGELKWARVLAIPTLRSALADEDEDVRLLAAEGLLQCGVPDGRVIETLLGALDQYSDEGKLEMATLLSRSTTKARQAGIVFISELMQANDQIRVRAVELLGVAGFGDAPQAIRLLGDAMEDPSSEIRTAAEASLRAVRAEHGTEVSE